MCKKFELVTGKASKGNIGELKGMTKMYRDAGMTVAIIRIPVELLEIDSRYQTDERTGRNLNYLTENWDERKLLPLIGVPHWEEGKVYIVDGYGRWIASQMVDKEKYEDIPVLLLLDSPQKEQERLEYEAELYAYQNQQVKDVTAIQRHGAMIVLHDKATETLEKMRKKYGFEYTSNNGQRESGVLGSYTEVLRLCNIDNGKCAQFVFDICRDAGFDRKANGYASYMIRSLRDIYKLYSKDRTKIKKFLVNILRKTTPVLLKSQAVSKYPILDFRTAVSLYVEDMVVKEFNLKQSREISGTRLVPIKTAM